MDTPTSTATVPTNNRVTASILEGLPFDVIEDICAAVDRVSRVTLLNLALASPTFYAAAIHTALRQYNKSICWKMDRVIPLAASNDNAKNETPNHYQVRRWPELDPGDFIAALRHHVGSPNQDPRMLDLECCYLVLPRRSLNWMCSPTTVNFERYNRLPVVRIPLEQVRHYAMLHSSLNQNAVAVPFPPFLHSLNVETLLVPGEVWHTLPRTLKSLRIVANRSEHAPNLQAMLASHFPPALCHLTLDVASLSDQNLASVFDTLPETIESLNVGPSVFDPHWEYPNKNAVVLAERLLSLPRLTTLQHRAWDMRHFQALLQALHARQYEPTLKSLHTLKLVLLQPPERDVVIDCLRLESPVILESLNVGLDLREGSDVDSDVFDEFIVSLIAVLPTGTKEMHVRFPEWTPSWANALAKKLHPGLHELALYGGSFGSSLFPFDTMHFPGSLRSISLCTNDDALMFMVVPQQLCVPDTLQCLDLSNNGLSTADLAGLLPRGWPPGLLTLRLDGNKMNQFPRQLPPNLRELSLRYCFLLREDEDQEEWAASLPDSLRMLDLSECGGLSGRFAHGLVDWAQSLPEKDALSVDVFAEGCDLCEDIPPPFDNYIFEWFEAFPFRISY
ncbi:hypothetical protein AMAG_10673 [Allomyces macrogynus ATCC 38327]|uniref:Uncharacterized protein n=1 Tax=Allomyces macrogynus (strain ATCC 38327) TaxID=578462 RepID=A0A0L0SR68_ALLM3|nr:hypothetical protein AMAG_10673 [Allomyces macrogynus ATCC 38327]|eukprot:KNE65007.1 hypothetical protein AMAG_10673 [Allomyces macrogynus ATCC 38327]